VRSFAAVRLEEAGETAERAAAHARAYLDLAERAEPHIVGGGRGTEWMERLVAEEGNLRAALHWFEQRGEAEAVLRMASALTWFWFTRGEFGEGRRRLEAALELGGGSAPLVVARGQVALGILVFCQGQVEGVRELLAEAVETLRGAGDRGSLTMGLLTLGTVINLAGDAATARAMLDEALAVSAEPGPNVLVVITLYHFGLAQQAWGDLDAAREDLRRAITIGRQIGNKPSIAHPSVLLGHLEYGQGRLDEALDLLSSGLVALCEIDDRWSLAQAVEGLAMIAADRGSADGAARLLGVSGRLRDEMGALAPWEQRPAIEAAAARLEAALGERAFAERCREGAALPLGRLVEEVVAVSCSCAASAGDCWEGVGAEPGSPPTGGPPATDPPTTASPATAPPATAGAGPLPPLRVAALGPLEVTVGGEPVADARWGSARARELLLILLLDGPRGRDQLADVLWPEAPADRARNSLHVTVHRLRRALGDSRWVVNDGELYALAAGAPVELDAADFEATARAALAGHRAGGEALAGLERALALYRGGLLAGLEVGEWADEARDRLERLCHEALAACAEVLIRRREFAGAADRLETLISRDGLDEEPYRQLMRCAAQLGQRSRALQLYRRLEARLRDELGGGARRLARRDERPEPGGRAPLPPEPVRTPANPPDLTPRRNRRPAPP
jgi:DNA-binding SARP family transcriptional activator